MSPADGGRAAVSPGMSFRCLLAAGKIVRTLQFAKVARLHRSGLAGGVCSFSPTLRERPAPSCEAVHRLGH